MSVPPAPQESAWVLKELPPRADSSNAEVKIASVLASVSCEKRCCSSACIDSDSKTLLVSRRSKTATRCCSPGASGSEYTRLPSVSPFGVQSCDIRTM
jgi:hypothetical protein